LLSVQRIPEGFAGADRKVSNAHIGPWILVGPAAMDGARSNREPTELRISRIPPFATDARALRTFVTDAPGSLPSAPSESVAAPV
jgi:hypothetical protein